MGRATDRNRPYGKHETFFLDHTRPKSSKPPQINDVKKSRQINGGDLSGEKNERVGKKKRKKKLKPTKITMNFEVLCNIVSL